MRKSEEVLLDVYLRNGTIGSLRYSCYEFHHSDSIDKYVVARNGELSDGANVRVASLCLGHMISMIRCDCHAQLELSLEVIASKENSVLIYCLSQDGRGHDTLAHLDAIKRMDEEDVDTYAALPDVRDYKDVTAILKDIGLSGFRLLTNNPDKVEALTELGFRVELVPIETASTKHNKKYLEQKKDRGHVLIIDGIEHVG